MTTPKDPAAEVEALRAQVTELERRLRDAHEALAVLKVRLELDERADDELLAVIRLAWIGRE